MRMPTSILTFFIFQYDTPKLKLNAAYDCEQKKQLN